MKPLLILAFKSAWARRLTLGIVLISITVSTALLLAVERVRGDARAGFAQSVSGIDLIVGARTSPIQLMLYAVFHTGTVTQNMKMDSFDSIAAHPAIHSAIPLSLGDAHQGYPVLGTIIDYFTEVRVGAEQVISFKQGRAFNSKIEGLYEAVLGHTIAKELGYQIGDHITLSHGPGALSPQHSDKPFTVVGILAPTGTPIDRTVHVQLAAITAIHLDWVCGAPVPGLKIPADLARKFDLRPKEITAVLVRLKNRSDIFKLQRQINGFPTEALVAVMPGVALDELWQTLAGIEQTLLAISLLVSLIGLAGLAATLLAGLNERRRELAILRALGAGPRDIFLLLTIEGLLITTLGIIMGSGLLIACIAIFAPWIQATFGVMISWQSLSQNELCLITVIWLTGLLASLVPGWRAWRLSLVDGLTPKY